MANSGPLARQPTKLDYASPTQFSFIINQLPKVQFFTVAANVPGITLGTTTLNSRFKDIPIQGDTIGLFLLDSMVKVASEMLGLSDFTGPEVLFIER